MQKQVDRLKSNKGSALIGAVVISALLSITVAGLMGMSRNTVSQESEASDDARAFLAAEAGLLMLTDWMVKYSNANSGSRPRDLPRGSYPDLVIDDVNVTVAVTHPIQGDNDEASRWLLSSTATVPGLPYSKTLEWVVGLQLAMPPEPGEPERRPSGAVGIFLGTSDASRGLRDTEFDGPVHFNGPIYINHIDKIKFHDSVTVHNPQNLGNTSFGVSTAWHENDYTRGILNSTGASKGASSTAQLDNIFTREFYNDRPRMGVRIEEDFLRHPLTARTSGDNVLTFGVRPNGQPFYTFNGTEQITYDRDVPVIISASTNFSSTRPLTVRGSATGMLGNVTVETTNGANIIIDLNQHNLAYQWFPTERSDFYNSDDNLTAAAATRYRTLAAIDANRDVLAFYSAGNIDLRNDGGGGHKGKVLTAQLFANNPGRTLTASRGGDDKVNLIGSASTNIFWHGAGNSGNNVIGGMWYHDPRRLSAPGITLIDADGNPILDVIEVPGTPDIPAVPAEILTRVRWREINTPL
jgi:hypothetical protein